jgi:hypothetical protein
MSRPPDPDRRLDELLREFRTPPPPDAGALWRRIEPELEDRAPPRTRAIQRPRRLWPVLAPALAAAAVALLFLVTPAERRSPPEPGQRPAASAPGARQRSQGDRQILEAVDEHLAATERFLRPVLAPGDDPGPAAPSIASDAADLLAQNDLLLASPRIAGAPQRQLLEDVELVLTQLAVDESEGFAAVTAGDIRLLERLCAAAGEVRSE